MWFIFFFFSSRRRHTRFDCDWSSDVCSSDLRPRELAAGEALERSIQVLVPESEAAQDRRRPLAPVIAAGVLEPSLRFAVPADRRWVMVTGGHQLLEATELDLQLNQIGEIGRAHV